MSTGQVAPFVPTYPDTLRAANRRIGQFSPYIQGNVPVHNAFMQMQLDRAAKGQMPYTENESFAALQAALTGNQHTQEKKSNPLNVLGNAVGNLRDLTSGLGKLFIPNRGNPLYQEAMAVPGSLAGAGGVLTGADNPLEGLGNLAATPGFRLLPGAYWAEHLLGEEGGGWQELARNPLFAALDVLPYAQGAIKGSKFYKAAEQARVEKLDARLQELSQSKIQTLYGEGVNPSAIHGELTDIAGVGKARIDRPLPAFRTAAKAKIPGFGKYADDVAENLSGSKAGRRWAELTGAGRGGRLLRGSTRHASDLDVAVVRSLYGDDGALRQLAESNPKGRKMADIIADKERLLEKYPQFGVSDDLTMKASEEAVYKMERGLWDDMTPDEMAFAKDVRRLNTKLRDYQVEQFPDQLVRGNDYVINKHESMYGEVFNKQDYAPVIRRDKKVTRIKNQLDIAAGDWKAAVKRAMGMDDMTRSVRGKSTQVYDEVQQKWVNTGLIDPAHPSRIETLPGAHIHTTHKAVQNLLSDDTIKLNVKQEGAARLYLSEMDRLNNMLLKQIDETGRIVDDSAHRLAIQKLMYQMDEPLAILQRMKALPEDTKNMIRSSRALNKATAADLRTSMQAGRVKTLKNQLARAELDMERAIGKATPARWTPHREDEFYRIVKDHIEKTAPESRKASQLEAIENRQYGNLPDLSAEEAGRLMRDMGETWMEAKARLDPEHYPVFVHRASPDAIKRMDAQQASVAASVKTPSSVIKRSWDVAPYVKNAHLALDHQAFELLQEIGAREMVETMESVYAKTKRSLVDEQVAKGLDYGEAARRIEQSWVPWDRSAFGPSRKISQMPTHNEELLIPKSLDDMLQKAYDSRNGGGILNAVFDPVMNVFRTAVLPFAPRWHVYNVLGGGMVGTANSPTMWRHMRAAHTRLGPFREAMKNAVSGERKIPVSSTGRAAPATRAGRSTTTVPDAMLRHPRTQLGIARSFMVGDKLKRLGNSIPNSTLVKKFGQLRDWSYAANQYVDDWFRTATEMDAVSKMKAGTSKEMAEFQAAQSVRNVAQNWDELLPAERAILRSVFPFYSWARFSIGFVMRYPFDHPVRAAVVGSIMRNEIEDAGTGLPDEFNALFNLSGVDDDGNAKFLRLAGANPFRDVADWFGFFDGFKLDGFIGQTNPAISAALQSMGVNPMDGGPMLYPELVYDPETGGLKADTPNFLESMLKSTLPQSQLVHNYVFGNEEWDELAAKNPDAARSMFLSQIGMPVFTREYNVPQEIMTAEVNRLRLKREEMMDAVKSGDLSALSPEQQAYAQQLIRLDQSGQLDAFRPEQEPGFSPLQLLPG